MKRITNTFFYKRLSPRFKAVLWVSLVILTITLIFIPAFLLYDHINVGNIEIQGMQDKILQAQDAIQRELDDLTSTTQN